MEQGASQETLESCTTVVRIPQVQGDSLSVVTASAICLYELSRECVLGQKNEDGAAEFIPDIP